MINWVVYCMTVLTLHFYALFLVGQLAQSSHRLNRQPPENCPTFPSGLQNVALATIPHCLSDIPFLPDGCLVLIKYHKVIKTQLIEER